MVQREGSKLAIRRDGRGRLDLWAGSLTTGGARFLKQYWLWGEQGNP